jgi:hypothetical protein
VRTSRLADGADELGGDASPATEICCEI